MAPIAESAEKETKHLELKDLILNVSIVSEYMPIAPDAWGFDKLSYVNFQDLDILYKGHDCLTGVSNEWMFSQENNGFTQMLHAATLPSFVSSNLAKLSEEFQVELTSVKRHFSLDKKALGELFKATSSKIAELDFLDSAVEITRNDSIKFTLVFPGDKMLMISVPFAFLDESSKEIIYSFFVNRELISTNAMELSAFVEGFNKYLQM